MITASKMELLNIVILKEKAEEVAFNLLKLGVFHPVDIRHIESELGNLTPFQIDKECMELDISENRTKDIIRKLNVPVLVRKDISIFSYEAIKGLLDNLEQKLSPLLSEKEELQAGLETKESIFSQIRSYPLFLLKRDSVFSFLEVSMGRIDEKNFVVLEKSFKDIPHVIYPFKKEANKAVALFIGLRRDRIFIDRVFKDLSWEKMEYPKEHEQVSKDVGEKISFEIDLLKKKIEHINEAIKALGAGSREELSNIQAFIMLKKSLLEAKKYSCITEKTVLFSGWVPWNEKQNVIDRVKKIVPISYMEAKPSEEVDVPKEDIPVYLKHGAFLKPFELLIDSYGIPRYGTIDPTIFVAISFLMMFGAMFGDLGQGIILSLASLFLRKSKNSKVRQASALFTYCGISAAIFGIFYGSFFGLEFRSIWIKPMDNILEIFKISIIFGTAVITLGILINIVNALKDRDYIRLIFDKAGLIGGVIYWAAIGLASKVFVSKGDIPAIYPALFFSGIALLFLKPFIEFIFKKEKEGLFVAIIEGIVNILEIFMGYLANTVSFIRIAAFSLAHAGLFLAIFELSRIVNSSAGAAASFLVVILGNILIILLEGLVVGIQSLRLNYYEFFSKFFIQGKQLYKPLEI